MALVVLLRGVNVGGHRTFKPSVLAGELKRFDVVNIGAAGTFVVRAPVSQAEVRAELARRLPFETEVMICKGSDVVRSMAAAPFADKPAGSDVVQFVSVLAKRRTLSQPVPLDFPAKGQWLLRILGHTDRFVFGMYRRQMKAIGYLGQLDKLFAVPVTTRNWNTMQSIVRILSSSNP